MQAASCSLRRPCTGQPTLPLHRKSIHVFPVKQYKNILSFIRAYSYFFSIFFQEAFWSWFQRLTVKKSPRNFLNLSLGQILIRWENVTQLSGRRIWAKLNELRLKSEIWNKDARQPLWPLGELEKAEKYPVSTRWLEGSEFSFKIFLGRANISAT